MSSLIYGFLQKRPVILRSLLIVATSFCNPSECVHIHMCIYILPHTRRRVDISTWCSVCWSVLQCVCSVYAVCCSVCCNLCCSVSLSVTRRRSRGVFLHGVIDSYTTQVTCKTKVYYTMQNKKILSCKPRRLARQNFYDEKILSCKPKNFCVAVRMQFCLRQNFFVLQAKRPKPNGVMS